MGIVNAAHAIGEVRVASEPRPGYFLICLVGAGPQVPAAITYGPPYDPVTGEVLERPFFWETTVNGEPIADPSPDPTSAKVFDVWHHGQPIDSAEYDYRMALRKHAIQYEPDMPEANPTAPIDLLRAPIPFGRDQ